MTKYKTIDELDARIERIIKKTVESYYTDWKHYDRPKYMKRKGSKDKEDKKMILIARKCGTYLLRTADIETREATRAIYDYYYQQSSDSHYYLINLDRLTIEKIDPAEYIKEVRKAA